MSVIESEIKTQIPNAFLKQLQRIVGKDFVHNAPEVLATYESDACVLMKKAPDLVVLPNTAEEVAGIVQACNQYNIPFIARGSGTGLSGGTMPMQGGVFIGLSRMNRILDIDVDNKTATVQPGVINAWLNRDARPYNLFFAPDPSSQAACSIGGNIAENAGGIHCVKYGVTVDHILNLEVVTPEGEIITVGGPNGHYQGLNWVGVIVGSEGTFGIVTRALVKLTALPHIIKVFLATFIRLQDATNAVADITASGIGPSALELIDDFTVKAVNAAFDTGFDEAAEAVLLIELDGSEAEVAFSETRLQDILGKNQVTDLKMAAGEAERLKLWKARKGAVAAYGRILPAFYLHDCVIPRNQLTHVLTKIQAIGKKYDVLIGNVFHAGDGNLHPNILLDPDDDEMIGRVLAAGDEILRVCLAVGGVLSGEHGIGIEKAEFMPLMFTESELAVMTRLKTAIDPKNLANPEKILPTRSTCGEVKRGLPYKMIQNQGVWI